jgi:hypothetical protein
MRALNIVGVFSKSSLPVRFYAACSVARRRKNRLLISMAERGGFEPP